MARMIDPSELGGEELFNWYRRSPAEVEAEREAGRQERYAAFVNSIGAAPEEGDSTSAASPSSGEEGVDGGALLLKAKFYRPFGAAVMTPPMMEPPSGPNAAPPLDARGTAPVGAPRSGFFGQNTYMDTLGGYYTDLPSPLNIVQATPAGWWDIGDGRRVRSDEVERIYAEQKRRLKGQEDPEPAARLRVVDRWKDGHIPRADQVEKGERELDPTCSPNGGWERDPGFSKYSDRTKQYETQITRAPGLDYVVRHPGLRPVKFDGCAVWDPRHPLLEAKGPGYAPLLPKSIERGFFGNMLRGAVDQADRQAQAAPGKRIEWHVAEPGALEFFEGATYPESPPIVVRQTLAR